MKNFIPIIITFSIFSIIILATVGFQSCQEETAAPELIPLKVGDQMPAINATISINAQFNEETLKTSDDKLVIIEFIDTHCGACRKSIPELQKLQQTFSDQITVILVTKQKDAVVRTAASSHQWSLPIITEDTLLQQLFPHQSVPHQVWIKDHLVEAITFAAYSQQENVRKMLAGKRLQVPLKSEPPVDFEEPLPGGLPPLYQSAFTPSLPYGSGIRGSDDWWLVTNASIAEFYQLAANLPAMPEQAYVVWDTGDSLRQVLMGPAYKNLSGDYASDSLLLAWREAYTFCYRLSYPAKGPLSRTTMLWEDLNKFMGARLGLEGAIENRIMPGLALVETDTTKHFVGLSDKEQKQPPGHMQIHALRTLISRMAHTHAELGIPIVNKTGHDGPVHLSIIDDLANLEAVNSSLEPYGLTFRKQPVEVEAVVIRPLTNTQ